MQALCLRTDATEYSSPVSCFTRYYLILTRKASGALNPAVVLHPLRVQNVLRSLKIRAQVMSIFEGGDLSYL